MERDLCIGGVEISNPCRTWAYLTGIGNRCFNGGNAPCCPGVSWRSGSYGALSAVVDDGDWIIGLDNPVEGLTVTDIREMTVGLGSTACPPPEELPDRYDEEWEPYLGGAWSFPIDVAALPELMVVAEGTATTFPCVLTAIDFGLAGMTAGTLWVMSYPTSSNAPVFAWEYADGHRTAWGAAAATAVAPRVYTDPESDAAPWYDPMDPRSKDVLGVWIDDIQVGRPHTKSVQSRQHGGSLSATRYGAREITIGGRVYVRTKAAGHYAKQWLYEALVGSPCGDDSCNPPTLQLTQWYDPTDAEAGIVYAHEVGLTDWQAVLDTTEPADCFVSFTATLAAQVPWLTKAPRHVITQGLLQSDPFCDHCGTGTESGACDETPAADILLACGCGDTPPMPLLVQNSECYVRPIWVARHYVEVQSPKLWTDGALRISVQGGVDGAPGAPSVKNLRFRVYHDPQQLGAAAGDTFICSAEPCADVSIGCVPYGATLIIDGAKRRGWVEINETERSADPYLSSNGGTVIWPEYACGSLLIAVDVDALQTAADSTFTIETVEIQRA